MWYLLLYCMLFQNFCRCINTENQIGIISDTTGVKTLQTQDTSDQRHFGTGAEVSSRHFGTSVELSGHIGTGVEVSYGHFGA